jgi:hypothetical protein
MKGKHDRQGHQGEAASDSQRSGPPAVHNTAHSHQPDAGDAANQSRDDEASAKDRQFRKVNMVLTLIFTGVLALCTAIYVWFAGGQWQAMDASLKEIRINREMEYRAYVGAKGAVFQPIPGNPAYATVTLVSINTGRTPVRSGTTIKRKLELRNEPPPDDTVLTEAGPHSKIAYLPNIEYTTYIGALQTGVADILKAQQTLAAQGAPVPQPAAKSSPSPQGVAPSLTPPEPYSFGTGYYLYGIIDYKDIFDRPHWTKFCFYIAPRTSAFALCPTFNDSN